MKLNILLSPDAAAGGGTTGTPAQPAQPASAPAQQAEQPAERPRNAPPGSELFSDDAEAPPTKEPVIPGVGNQGSAPPAEPEDGEAAATPQPEAERPTGLTRDDIQEILRAVVPQAPAAPAQPQTPAPQLSQDEFDRLFNVAKFDEGFVAALRSEDPKKVLEALHSLRDSLVKQVMTMAEYRTNQHLTQLRETAISPLATYVQERQAADFRNDFFEKYPDLEQYDQIVDAVAAKVAASGWQGKTRNEIMERFANDSRAVLATLLKTQAAQAGAGADNGAGVGQRNTRGAGAQPVPARRMSTLTSGGQGGNSNRGSTGGAKGPPGIEVWD